MCLSVVYTHNKVAFPALSVTLFIYLFITWKEKGT